MRDWPWEICFWLEAKIGVLLFLYFLTAGSWQAVWEEKQEEGGEKEGILDKWQQRNFEGACE